VTQGASSASTFTASTASTSFTATTTSSTATPSTTATRMLAAMLVLPLCQAFTVSYSGHAEAPVLVELYYESFCPGCRAFLTGMLYPAYDKLKDTGVMEVVLYPYGNAHEKQNPDGSYSFQCQHGGEECRGNLLELCVMAHSNWDFHSYLPVISCMEGADNPVTATKGCLEALSDVPYPAVKACAWGAEGNAMMHEVANRTASLDPPHTYVPWITVQGVHTEEVEQEAMSDLVSLVCKLYKGPQPGQCSTAFASPNLFIEKDWRVEEEEEKVVAEEEPVGIEEVIKDNNCVLCKYVISTLDGILEDKTNEKEIEEALEGLCSYLPSSVTKECDAFVTTYTSLIIDMLSKDVTPEMVCDNLGLCQGFHH